MSKQLIKYAKTHAEIFIPSMGTFKTTLPPDNRTLKNFTMSRTDLGGILIEVTNDRGQKDIAEIPAGDVAFMVYGAKIEDEAPKKQVVNAPNSKA